MQEHGCRDSNDLFYTIVLFCNIGAKRIFVSLKEKSMKKLLYAGLLALAFGCSSDSDGGSMVEDGTNPKPNQKAAGSSAHDFLSDDDYQSLTIEILYIGQYRPSDAAVASLQNFMDARLNKPGGVHITLREIDSPGTSPYTTAEIRQLEADNRTAYNDVGELALCILFVDGKSSSDTNTSAVLGTAYLNTSCVIYENTVFAFSNGVNQPPRAIMEGTVLQHELCHLLGLVNFGTDMVTDHEDDEHKRHCDNPNCLMYWASQNRVMNLQTSQVPSLDANCIADLQGNGGK